MWTECITAVDTGGYANALLTFLRRLLSPAPLPAVDFSLEGAHGASSCVIVTASSSRSGEGPSRTRMREHRLTQTGQMIRHLAAPWPERNQKPVPQELQSARDQYLWSIHCGQHLRVTNVLPVRGQDFQDVAADLELLLDQRSRRQAVTFDGLHAGGQEIHARRGAHEPTSDEPLVRAFDRVGFL